MRKIESLEAKYLLCILKQINERGGLGIRLLELQFSALVLWHKFFLFWGTHKLTTRENNLIGKSDVQDAEATSLSRVLPKHISSKWAKLGYTSLSALCLPLSFLLEDNHYCQQEFCTENSGQVQQFRHALPLHPSFLLAAVSEQPGWAAGVSWRALHRGCHDSGDGKRYSVYQRYDFHGSGPWESKMFLKTNSIL